MQALPVSQCHIGRILFLTSQQIWTAAPGGSGACSSVFGNAAEREDRVYEEKAPFSSIKALNAETERVISEQAQAILQRAHRQIVEILFIRHRLSPS